MCRTSTIDEASTGANITSETAHLYVSATQGPDLLRGGGARPVCTNTVHRWSSACSAKRFHCHRTARPIYSSAMPLFFFALLLTTAPLQQSFASIVSFFSPEDLKYTFGVDHISKVPAHREIYPNAIYSVFSPAHNTSDQQHPQLHELIVELEPGRGEQRLAFHPSVHGLLAPHVIVVERTRPDGGGSLRMQMNHEEHNCHFQHTSEHSYAAMSTCGNDLKGVIINNGSIYVLHPIPTRHMSKRTRRSADPMLESGDGMATMEEVGLHVLYKRETLTGAEKPADFCGVDSVITTEQLIEDEAGVHQDAFVIGQQLAQESELVVELAIFVDEHLWQHFSSIHGSYAWQKLQQYALTMLNNIQIMYNQPTIVPRLTFRIVRFEVFKSQPSAISPNLHSNGHAQTYLDLFCRYQRSLGSTQDWDHALMLTGHDIHRGGGATSISGIARLDGMCDPWNTCTLAEGLDFTSAFIGTHELGHSVGMRHDEPYCPPSYIMSSSLGPGKVTWSSCSIRDYVSFIQRLDNRRKNCLRDSYQREKLPITSVLKPGQVYDANLQCALMHGNSYIQISPRQDHYDGLCWMMWCGQGQFGRIITSHPALEGTFCGASKWCQLGRCVPWTGFGAPLTPPQPASAPAPAAPAKVDGQWSAWSPFYCQQCYCSSIIGALGVTIAKRTCTNPVPQNGGNECEGSTQRAAICNRRCNGDTQTVDQYISAKCQQHRSEKNDLELTGTGSQLSRYPQRSCKVFCDVRNAFGTQKNYRFYGDNLPDGTPCGWNRHCLGGECLDLSCEESTLSPKDVAACPAPHERCSVAAAPSPSQNSLGQWAEWSVWSACTVSCGSGGIQVRTRVCNVVNQCEGEATEKMSCNSEIPCSTAQWNQCSVSCGRGSQARYRRCTTSQNGVAYSCSGSTMDIQACDELPCRSRDNAPSSSLVGQWATWSAWATCSTTCGPGTQLRERVCRVEPCDGPGQERMACNLHECSSVQTWNEWSEWSQCSRVCGSGVRSRSRTCKGPGACLGLSLEQGNCNPQACSSPSPWPGGNTITAGEWGAWTAWSACSTTCGVGVKRRTRDCTGGQTCPETCGQGVRRRVRKCYGSGTCFGNEYEKEDCYLRVC